MENMAETPEHDSNIRASDSRLTMTVEEAGKALGISRASAYLAARNGELPTVRIGRRYLVPIAALQRLLSTVLPHERSIGGERR